MKKDQFSPLLETQRPGFYQLPFFTGRPFYIIFSHKHSQGIFAAYEGFYEQTSICSELMQTYIFLCT